MTEIQGWIIILELAVLIGLRVFLFTIVGTGFRFGGLRDP